MCADPASSSSGSFSSAFPHKPETRQACATASRCGQCRGSCGNAGVHRDDASPVGGPAADPAGWSENQAAAAVAIPAKLTESDAIAVLPRPASPRRSWLGERPWLWFYAAFVVLIIAWTSLIVVAVKNQPAPISIKARTTRAHD